MSIAADIATHGHARKRDLPADGGKAKVCPKCQLWFSQQPRERVCTGCRPNWQAAHMALRRAESQGDPAIPGDLVKLENAQVAGTRSDVLGITFKPVVPLYRQMALEAAAVIDGKTSTRAIKDTHGCVVVQRYN